VVEPVFCCPLHDFLVVDRLSSSGAASALPFSNNYSHRRAGFSFLSRVLAGLETPRTTTVPSAAFIPDRSRLQLTQTTESRTSLRTTSNQSTTLASTSLFIDTQSHYCFIDVADSHPEPSSSSALPHWRRFNPILTCLTSYQSPARASGSLFRLN
jgi:hypothetical protein